MSTPGFPHAIDGDAEVPLGAPATVPLVAAATVPLVAAATVPLVAAATVVVVRAAVRAGTPALEVLMLQRSRSGNFGGAWVFPGGKIDPIDHRVDGADSGSDLVPADVRAAVRECHEEAGLRLEISSVGRWSHWTPPVRAGVRFSTAFFVAEVPEIDAEVVVDGGEIVRHRWMTPQDIAGAHRSGELALAPPTFITVCQLSGHTAPGDVIATAATHVVEHFQTRIAVVGSEVLALYHGDSAYESLEPEGDGLRHRLVMTAADGDGRTAWTYTRDPETRPR